METIYIILIVILLIYLIYITLFKGNEYEYGICNDVNARRHKYKGNVQFILWRKGDQKHIDGVGHLTDKWVNFDNSHWCNFKLN